jgi:peroxin-6
MAKVPSSECIAHAQVDCYHITSDPSVTATHLQARLAKSRAASPCILLLHHIEALSKKSDAATSGRQSGIVKTLQDAVEYMRESGKGTGWSTVLVGTAAEMSNVEDGVGAIFKQEIEIGVSGTCESCCMK